MYCFTLGKQLGHHPYSGNFNQFACFILVSFENNLIWLYFLIRKSRKKHRYITKSEHIWGIKCWQIRTWNDSVIEDLTGRGFLKCVQIVTWLHTVADLKKKNDQIKGQTLFKVGYFLKCHIFLRIVGGFEAVVAQPWLAHILITYKRLKDSSLDTAECMGTLINRWSLWKLVSHVVNCLISSENLF